MSQFARSPRLTQRAVVPSTVPPGFIMLVAGSSDVPGWFICDGRAVSRVNEASLFAAIGTTYGAGDGTTTFNIPNITGPSVVGGDPARPVRYLIKA